MNFIRLLSAFAPFIVFGLLAGHTIDSVKIAIVAAFLLTIILGYSELRQGFILSWGTLIFFTFLIITVVLMTNMWVLQMMNVLVYVTLAAITWIGIIAGRPFVMQYARQEVDESRWQDPNFLRVVRDMTLFWGIAFLLDTGVAIYQLSDKNVIFKIATYLIMLIAIVFTMYYPNWVRSRSRAKEGATEA
jgi:hypothetical protein